MGPLQALLASQDSSASGELGTNSQGHPRSRQVFRHLGQSWSCAGGAATTSAIPFGDGPLTHILLALDPFGRSCQRILAEGQPTATPLISPNRCVCRPQNPRRQEPARGPLKRLGHSGAAPPQADSAPGANQGQTGTPWLPQGPPRAPAQGHPARGGRGSGAGPPSRRRGGDLPGPSHGSASASRRGRGGARGCGCDAGKGPGKGRWLRPRGGAGAGPDFPARRPRRRPGTHAARAHDEAAPGAERLRQRVGRTHRRGPRGRAEVRLAGGAGRAGASRLGSKPTGRRARSQSWSDRGRRRCGATVTRTSARDPVRSRPFRARDAGTEGEFSSGSEVRLEISFCPSESTGEDFSFF